MRTFRLLITTLVGLALLGVPQIVAAGQATPEADEGLFISPRYGFEVSWDDTWSPTAREESNDLQGDLLVLVNGLAAVRFASGNAIGATPHGGDPVRCVNDMLANIESSPDVVEFSVPIQQSSSDSPSASAVVTHDNTESDGQIVRLVNYVECITLVPGQSALLIVTTVQRSNWNSQLAPICGLLDNLVLPPAVGAVAVGSGMGVYFGDVEPRGVSCEGLDSAATPTA